MKYVLMLFLSLVISNAYSSEVSDLDSDLNNCMVSAEGDETKMAKCGDVMSIAISNLALKKIKGSGIQSKKFSGSIEHWGLFTNGFCESFSYGNKQGIQSCNILSAKMLIIMIEQATEKEQPAKLSEYHDCQSEDLSDIAMTQYRESLLETIYGDVVFTKKALYANLPDDELYSCIFEANTTGKGKSVFLVTQSGKPSNAVVLIEPGM